MGYTHYWKQTKNFSTSDWKAITDFTRKAIKLSGVKIADGFGEGAPNITDKRIWINGTGNEGHETFFISKTGLTDFEFTKTAQKPYDAVVVAILLYIRENYPAKFEVSSDGNIFNPESPDAIPGTELMLKSLIELKSEILYSVKKS